MERVTEFRVRSSRLETKSRDQRIRLVLWGSVLALLAITVVALGGVRDSWLNTALLCAAVITVIGVVGGAYVVAYQTGMRRLRADITVCLTDTELMERRPGWPEKTVRVSEIRRMAERCGWLMVEGSEFGERILIPTTVENSPVLRAELCKHGTIFQRKQSSLLALIPALASLFCWALVFWSTKSGVVDVSASLGVVLLAWSSYKVAGMMRRHPKRIVVWLWLSMTWMMAFWILYRSLRRF